MKRFLITIVLFLSFVCIGQKTIDKRENNEMFGPWYFPSEIKYGGLVRASSYHSQLYVALMPLGYNYSSADGTRNFIAIGPSFSKQFKSNYLSIYGYIGQTHWVGSHFGFKLEPLINLENGHLDYINIEVLGGLIGSLNLTAGIPTNSSKNPFFIGLKIGFCLPYPSVMIMK